MTNRIEQILESIKTNAGSDVCEKIRETCGNTDVKAIISELENTCGVAVVAAVMKPCGSRCIPKSFVTRAKAIYSQSQDLNGFLQELNKTRIGGGKLHVRDGKIIGTYDRCYCSLAKKTKGLSPLFCHCSEGWYEKLFSSVFEKLVTVKKLQTVLDGSPECEFEISY